MVEETLCGGPRSAERSGRVGRSLHAREDQLVWRESNPWGLQWALGRQAVVGLQGTGLGSERFPRLLSRLAEADQLL